MRILHVLDHSLPLHSGYTFRTLAILAEQRRRGWETDHLTSPKHYAPGPPVETVDGWTFHRTATSRPALAKTPVVSEIALMADLAGSIEALARRVRPDILHAHSPVLNALPALWVGRRLGLPVVYEVRASWEDAAVSHGTARQGDLRYRASRAVETFAVKRAGAVTTICEGLRADLAARGVPAEKISVVPNAVDTAAFKGPGEPDAALAARHGLTGKTLLGFFGSFYRYEGLHLLIAALPSILAARPEIRVLLVGGGFEEERLKAQAREVGVAEKIVFAGRVPHREISRYYDLADLLVYPRQSIRLTEIVTPLKPLEAMAQGRIVVASDVGGHRELIRDRDTGYLFRPDDPTALAAKIGEVLDRRADWPAMRARARDFVESDRNWRRSVDGYEEVYRRLAAA